MRGWVELLAFIGGAVVITLAVTLGVVYLCTAVVGGP